MPTATESGDTIEAPGNGRVRLRDRSVFLGKFLKQGVTIGSVTPSSRWMSRELARYVDPSRPQKILELGAGTGVVTRVIEDTMHPESTLVAVEALKDFEPMLRRSTRRTHLIIDRVERVWRELVALGPFDVVVNCLPLPSLPARVRASVLRVVDLGAPNSMYSQLTEFPLLFLPVYKRYFRNVKFVMVPLNIPPGGVYHCTGVRRPSSKLKRARERAARKAARG
ncbi:MAG: hypothetical protein GC200_11830 [Tepidisphaera sp.]|nr:hypothetical protein [Tepidisphaera sp.]